MNMTRLSLLLLIASSCCTLVLAEDNERIEPCMESYDCRYTDFEIKIDGKAEEAWSHAVEITAFSMPWLGEKNHRPEKATRAKLLYDRDYLYVFAEMDDADLYADITEHDGKTWLNDVFEMFLKPAVDKPAYYEFQVNAANTQFDLFQPRRGHVARFLKDGAFDIESKVVLRGSLNKWTDQDEGWSVELRLPWTSLMRTGGRPNPGDEWRFALCRYDWTVDRESPELTTCAPLDSKTHPDFHSHEDYAKLRFVGPESKTSARPYGLRFAPVTTNKVQGSPSPPLPFTVAQTQFSAKVAYPVTVAHQPGSDRLLYITQPGPYAKTTVLRMREDSTPAEPEVLLEPDGTVHYSIKFHPDFAKNGYLYVGSNGAHVKDKPKRTRITRYTVDRQSPYEFHRDSARVIIEWESDGHNGGDVAFGNDGMMYVTSGDGTSDSDTNLRGQDLTHLTAKVLRIDVDHPDAETAPEGKAYVVPKDNPFSHIKDARPETWAYGLRNPWRITCDPQSGQIWVGNNGQDLWEQAYLIQRGANYGWSVMEGGHPFASERQTGPTPISKPTADHAHAESRSLTGGIVYRGTQLPDLVGAYIYGDYSTGRIWGIRHDGAKVTWHKLLADTALQITAFAADSKGELLILDHHDGDQGGFYRLVPKAAIKATADFPRRLSESGLFRNVAKHELVAGAIPYGVNSPLWSDGAHKLRYIVLPPATDAYDRVVSAKIEVTNEGSWNLPEGTVLVKSFALDLEDDNPQSRRWIETRFLVLQQGEWAGYSYQWDDAQTDAMLVEAEGQAKDFEIRGDGGVRTQKWHYPSRTECMVCHSRAAKYILGISTAQLNREFDYHEVLGGDSAKDDQLRTFESLGVLSMDWSAEAKKQLEERAKAAGVSDANKIRARIAQQTEARDRPEPARSSFLPDSRDTFERLADPYDSTQDLASRARSYLHTNCSSCHVAAGGGNARIDLKYSTELEKTKLLDEKPMHNSYGLNDARLIAPGAPERSILLERISRRGPGQMPQLGTNVVDKQAVALIQAWIESLAKK
ncbi:MAG: putative repeat protein (TIGR03806 family) [Pirellulaceae bacterium]|jgi:uncharacterized repeat protein (TIGR03806 family)